MSNENYEQEIKKYKLALVVMVSILFVVVFAFSCMIGAMTGKDRDEGPVVTTTEPPVTEPPVVRTQSMVSNTDSGTYKCLGHLTSCR